MEAIFYNILIGLIANSHKSSNALDANAVIDVFCNTVHEQIPRHSRDIISTVLTDLNRVLGSEGNSSVASATGVGISTDLPDLPVKADRTSV